MRIPAWIELTDAEEEHLWDRFHREFAFRPSVRPEDWPGIREPVSSITYAVPDSYTDEDLDDLHRQVLGAFRACTRPEERLYALDWQHLLLLVPAARQPGSPRRATMRLGLRFCRAATSGASCVLPDGDYSIFLAEDFRFGIFGHLCERTWCSLRRRTADGVGGRKAKDVLPGAAALWEGSYPVTQVRTITFGIDTPNDDGPAWACR